jgi:hypothetical protein
MPRLAFLPISLFLLASPVLAADWVGPLYGEDDVVVERDAPPVVERERIIEYHRYYEPVPVYRERRIVIEEPRVYYVPRPYDTYGPYDADWRLRSFWHHYRGW